MPPGQDQYVSLPDGSYVHVPGNATPQQLDQLRTKLSTQYAGRPIADTSTISAAPKPSLLEQAKAPFQEVGAPLWNATVGGISSIPFVGKYLPNLRAEETPASGTAVSNIENLTQQGRAEHPWEAKIGDLFRNAGQLSRTISPEIATLGIADAGSSIPDATGRIPQAFAKTFRNPEGEIAVTPSAILDRVIPQRSEIIGKQTADDLQSRMQEAEDARQKELVAQERLREQHARSLNARKEPTAEVSPFSGAGVTSTAGIPSSGIPHVPRPVSGIEPGIPQVSSTNPLLDVSLSAPKIIPQATGAAQKPFEPLIYESPEEANAIDFRNANLKRQASAAGTFHAAQGGVGKKFNLQQRIARRYGGTP